MPNSCRTLNENNECIECNHRGDGTIWKTQEDYCVVQCSYPYSELPGDHCGIFCNHGFYLNVDNAECEACPAGCKVCSDSTTCRFCYEMSEPKHNSACDLTLTCPGVGYEQLWIHDYNPFVTRCVSECSEPNSILSERDDLFTTNFPLCRYCGEDCLDCKEDDVNTNLYCTRCDNGKTPF